MLIILSIIDWLIKNYFLDLIEILPVILFALVLNRNTGQFALVLNKNIKEFTLLLQKKWQQVSLMLLKEEESRQTE